MATKTKLAPTTPYDEAVEKFLGDIGSTKTQLAYRTGAKVFREFLETRRDGPLMLDVIDDGDILIEFWRWLKKKRPSGQWQKDSKRLSEQSIQSYLAATAALLAFLSEEDALPETFSLDKARGRLRRARRESKTPYPTRQPDPRLPLVVLHYDRIEPPTRTAQEREAYLRLLRDRAIVHVLYSTAGRISEVAQLNRNDVGDGHAESAIVIGKGRKPRTLFFTPEARHAIQAYLKERTDSERALFVGHSKKSQSKLGAASLWLIVKKAAKAEGLSDIHPHDFRHLRASQMLNEGARLEEVQEILGHADISTTRKIYAAFSRLAVKEAFENYRLSPEEALKKAENEGRMGNNQ
jgi:integrase/recombinase XerD